MNARVSSNLSLGHLAGTDSSRDVRRNSQNVRTKTKMSLDKMKERGNAAGELFRAKLSEQKQQTHARNAESQAQGAKTAQKVGTIAGIGVSAGMVGLAIGVEAGIITGSLATAAAGFPFSTIPALLVAGVTAGIVAFKKIKAKNETEQAELAQKQADMFVENAANLQAEQGEVSTQAAETLNLVQNSDRDVRVERPDPSVAMENPVIPAELTEAVG